MTQTFTATVQWDENNGANVYQRRFYDAPSLSEFLIEQFTSRVPILAYCHNLEWDLQILWLWGMHPAMSTEDVRLQYVGHTARRNGSALVARFDYDGRHSHHPMVTIRDSFAIYSVSLASLGKSVGVPKLRTPREYLPKIVSPYTGELIDNPGFDNESDAVCEHGKAECLSCYDLRDVEILHTAMRTYIRECDEAEVRPAFTRSAHAMADFRTNFMDEPLVQYTEKQNVRAEFARYGGRVQMLQTGIIEAADDEVIVQADVKSQYPSVMIRGEFPDADYHEVLFNRKADVVREYVGWAWAEVHIPPLPLGPLIYRHPQSGRISYPVDCTLQGAWTTDELACAMDVGCQVRKIVRLEGCPRDKTIDPFSRFIRTKYDERARLKEAGDPLQESVKLTMNGLSGKFGMRWMEPRLEFVAAVVQTGLSAAGAVAPVFCEADPKDPVRYPDYIMTPWSALIMARGRIVLFKFGMRLHELGAKLLCCDTDSWTFLVKRSTLEANQHLFGGELGDWDNEGEYEAFQGRAPKEYALYRTRDDLVCDGYDADGKERRCTVLGGPPHGHPYKARAKGVGVAGDTCLIDHYLRYGEIHFQRPNKTRSVIGGSPAATFVPVEKRRRPRVVEDQPYIYFDFAQAVRDMIAEAEKQTLSYRYEKGAPSVKDETPEALPWKLDAA